MMDWTFVFIGPPAKVMEHNIPYIRQHYPNARIYTSFTETPTVSYNPDPNTLSNPMEFYSHHKLDLIRANVDPGRLSDDGNSSINRRLLNTKEILLDIRTSHIAMFRADCIIDTPHLEQLYQYYQTFHKPRKYEHWKERVVISDHFTVNPFGNLRLLYHPGDHFHIGRTDILQNWFGSIPLRNEQELFTADRTVSSRPEQYLCPTQFKRQLKNHIDYDIDRAQDWMVELVANFAVDSTYFRCTKYPHPLNDDFISTNLWKTLTYCL